MSKHNYTNPAFCQSSEFYPVPSSGPIASYETQSQHYADDVYNRSLSVVSAVQRNKPQQKQQKQQQQQQPRDGPLRIQRSMSTRSFVSQKSTTTATTAERKPTVTRQQLQRQHYEYQLYQQQQQQHNAAAAASLNRTTDAVFDTPTPAATSGRYALVPVEEFRTTAAASSRYAIVPGPSTAAGTSLSAARRYAKSQENLECLEPRIHYQRRNVSNTHDTEEPHSFHEGLGGEEFTSLPPAFDEHPKRRCTSPPTPKIKHAFSSDFGSKSYLLVDKNSNQRYQMVPTAENEELVDDNQEIIQMHNGRAHRYAVIPTEEDAEDEYGDDDDLANEDDGLMEEETCLSNGDFSPSRHGMALNFEPQRTPLRTSTPQKGSSTINLITTTQKPPTTPLKNPAATKMLHELLSTPRKTPLGRITGTTPRFVPCNREQLQQLKRERRLQQHQHYMSQQHIYYTPNSGGGGMIGGDGDRQQELITQGLHYDATKATGKLSSLAVDRTMAVISPRVAAGSKVYPQLEETIIDDPKSANNNSYPQKVANATITLAVISLMLVLGSSMNCALSIYMIAHFGKSFYLLFSLIASLCGVGLGFLGFRSRHCDWLPNRSYTSGYILVTAFSLLKCCGLLVILVLDPYPGLPLHDVTTGVILGLSSFMMFFIGLGVIGSMWCYRPPPDNRVNVV